MQLSVVNGCPASVGFGQPLIDAGLDPAEISKVLAAEYAGAGGPPKTEQQPLFQHYMIPNLERVGLITDRVRPTYQERGYLAS
jgi:hypothetical protein